MDKRERQEAKKAAKKMKALCLRIVDLIEDKPREPAPKPPRKKS